MDRGLLGCSGMGCPRTVSLCSPRVSSRPLWLCSKVTWCLWGDSVFGACVGDSKRLTLLGCPIGCCTVGSMSSDLPSTPCLFAGEYRFQLCKDKPWITFFLVRGDWFGIKSLAMSGGAAGQLSEGSRDTQQQGITHGSGCFTAARSDWTMRGPRCVPEGQHEPLSPLHHWSPRVSWAPLQLCPPGVLLCPRGVTSLDICTFQFWEKITILIQINDLAELMNEAIPAKN